MALDAFPLPGARLRLIAHEENTTFRVDSGGGAYLLRVHRPGKHPLGYVDSELSWLAALRRDTGLAVPEPVPASSGAITATVGAPGVPEERVCSVLRWQLGRRLSAGARPVHLARLGSAMARLHEHVIGWERPAGFGRERWDAAGLFGGAWEMVPPAHRARWERVAGHVGELMARLGDDPATFNLIHADLHLDNVLFRDGTARLIDFDDCGFGHFVYDAAVALWELRGRADYPRWRDAFLAGYGAVRPLAHAEHIDAFIAGREVTFGRWFAGMARTNPAMAGRLDEELAFVDASLARLGF